MSAQQDPGFPMEQAPAAPNKSGEHPLANYQFSPEEMRVLKQCDVESLFKRSIPLGTGFGLAAYYAVQKGLLKGSAKWGAGPKVALGVIFGYFLGKFSYQRQCAEKIMQLPNSKLAEMLRMKKRGGLIDTLTPDTGFGAALSLAPFSSAQDQYSDVQESTSLNMDTERPSNSGLDDTFRPNVDGPNTQFSEIDLPLEAPKGGTTYDNLRQQNRDAYAKKQQNPYYKPIQSEAPPVIRAPPRSDDEQTVPLSRKAKNKYGDDWTV